MTLRPRRSALYLPASNLKAIEKAKTLPCDIVILDLEDAVAPEAKILARAQAVAAVQQSGFGTRELVVRVNGLDTEWGQDDLASIATVTPDAVLLPKVSAASDVRACEALISTPIWAMIETARAMFRLEEIATASRTGRLACLVMGTNDLASEMGAHPGVGRAPFLGMLGLSVAAARAYGLGVLDGVFNALDDPDGLEQQCRQAVEFGFDGKTLIHPNQIDICNRAFTPRPEAIAWAQRILQTFDEPENAGKGALRIDGKMVERLHLAQARRTLALAGVGV